MAIIKRLYLFILKSFIPLFAMTFFIVLFIVLMQFLWKHIDDLVGKGLELTVIGELFFYAAVTMVPMALPLAILLASLMTFGNFGEKFELTAMKASGISLLKVMSPLIVFISFISVGAFFFQNYILPMSQVKMYTLLFSMRQKSPELEIPEGVFYQNIPGYNLFVVEKNRETGMLREITIYDVSRGGDNATILRADSGRLAFTPDMRYLYLHLFEGEQFENLREQKTNDRNVPFRRETFKDKEVLIPFDANFNRLDEEGMRNQYVGKNISELRHTVDSVSSRIDSVGAMYANGMKYSEFAPLQIYKLDNPPQQAEAAPEPMPDANTSNAVGHNQGVSEKQDDGIQPIKIDTVIDKLSSDRLVHLYTEASAAIQRKKNDMEYRAATISEDKRTIRRHEIEMIKKFTLSVACLVFFFIGAPLGAIIRKGGLGTPLVISVLLFLFYYIIDNTGYKMARDGHWVVWVGIWLSTFVLAPLGVYVTYKAMNDSAVFDADVYKAFFRKLFGTKVDRKVNYKEVIIDDISDKEALSQLSALKELAVNFIQENHVKISYTNYWRHGFDISSIETLRNTLETTVENLTNLRNPLAVNKLVDYPVIRILWIYHPVNLKWLADLAIWLAPIGFPVYLLGLRSRRILLEDVKRISEVSTTISNLLTTGQP